MAFRARSNAERLTHTYEGATLFWHRLFAEDKQRIRHECTERGVTDDGLLVLRGAQAACDGWVEDGQVQNADGHPMPVPGGTPEERRAGIAAEVAKWDDALLAQLFMLAWGNDDGETVRKNSPDIFRGGSSLPVAPPDASSPVPTVAPSAAPSSSPSPATVAG